ncbi:GH92 family glycosyl hydrolase [Arachidicoccus sp.]|uniref:GH92 family glycosyl hydrolase n=1 Tax=Arachidicoccus sp. TaxID=1872624 RepID=UPI003D221E71
MKKILSFAIVILIGCNLQAQQMAPVDFVNPFIGASTSVGDAGIYHGLGKTFPGATTPYGLVQVSPNTITGGDNGSGYSFEHTSIEGFAFTQMSGVGWYGDLGNFLVMPTTGPLNTASGSLENPSEGYRSKYAKKSEKATAGYYSVFLDKYKIKAEMTATAHCGMLRFTYPDNKDARIQIDLARRVGGTSTVQYIKIVDSHTIEGWMKCDSTGGGWGDGAGKSDYTVYFYAQFDKPLKDYGVWSVDIPDNWGRKLEDVTSKKYQQRIADAAIINNIKEYKGKHLGFFTNFSTSANEVVQMKSGISFVSMKGAEENLKKEIKGWDFDAVHQKARDLWNEALQKIKIDGGTADEKTVFYTALYHTMIDPRIASDVDGKYTGGGGKVYLENGFKKRTIFSGWDVFRSQMPLQTIINPSLVNDLLNSLITLGQQSDKPYFSRWEFLNAYSGCMLGNPAVAVLADAYVKNIRGYNTKLAYKFAVNSVEKFGNGKKGYSTGGIGVSNTLEYAYNDWCVSILASLMHKTEDERKYSRQGQDYKNIFDSSVKWFRPRNEDGSWQKWPKGGRLAQGYGTMESNLYQQGWFVPQDIDGMIALMGGKQKVKKDLINLFEKTPANFMWNDYYNQANEPVHHVPFLFNRVDAPWLTQKWTRIICKNAYLNSVEGLVGNEDVGQMSAWYVLAASGIYPICPGSNRYEITSPVFRKIAFQLDNKYARGKTFTIIAHSNSPKNIYILRAKLNGVPYDKCYINYSDIIKGGTLELFMAPKPNRQWGKN